MNVLIDVSGRPPLGGRSALVIRGDDERWRGRLRRPHAKRGTARTRRALEHARGAACAVDSTQRWSVWAAGYGGAQTTDGNAALGSNNAASRIYGVAAGADYGSRRKRWQASRWPAAAPTSASPMAQRPTPTYSRPAPSSGISSVRLILSGAGLWLAGRHHRRTVTVAGVDQFHAQIQRQCLIRPLRGRLSLRRPRGSVALN